MSEVRTDTQDAADELEMYAVNTAELYPAFLQIIANLTKKIQKGTYNPELAPKAFRSWLDESAKQYRRELGPSEYRFTAAAKNLAAESIASDTHAAMLNGEYDS